MSVAKTARLRAHPLADLVPEMPAPQWQAFLADVAERGILDPIQLAPDGRTVIDGRHRLRAARELGLAEVPVVSPDLQGLTEVEYMVRAALGRRHLSDDQRAIVAARLAAELSQERRREAGRAAARARWQGDASGPPVSPTHAGGRSREAVAPTFGVSVHKVRKAGALCAVAPELGQKVLCGELKIKEADALWHREQSLKAMAEVPDPPPGELARILNGDFRQLAGEIPDESVDLVFTDPPYMESALPLWRDLASLARRALKPGGFLIAYSGHLCLPQVMAALGSELDYYWQAIIPFKGQKPSIHERQVRSGFRVVLIYVKPPVTQRPWFFDVVEADSSPDKRFHDWGQSVKPARYFVSRFSQPGELVLDPFCGAGAFPVAAVVEGRRALGIELDPSHAEVASKRAALAEQELSASRDRVPSQNHFGAGEGDGREP